LTGALVAYLCTGALHAETLLEIYQRALQSDPLIREAEANRLANSEALPQARGLLFPQVTASGSEDRASSAGTEAFTQQTPQGPITSTTTFENRNVETTNWNLQLTQTVFRWDQYVGLQQAGKRVAEAEANYEAAQQDLIVRVAQRYFDVLGAQDDLDAAEASRVAISRQLDQAQKRFEVGLIAITDVQEAQAAFDQAVADEIAAKRALATSREFLREITGEYVSELAKPGEELPLKSPAPADEDNWVTTAMDQNLSLLASRISAEIASKEISARRGGHYPTVDLVVGRRSSETDLERSNSGGPFAELFSDNTGDSISLQVSVPVFSGFRTSSQVREAVYLHRAARERLQRIARETERQTRDAYLGVLTEISRVKALKQALQSSETALDATKAGFDVGTRTTVDVLDAQRQLFNARTSYYRARYDYLLNVLRLKQAAGILRLQDLEEINRFLEEPAT
jgi:outer membrane protein